MAITASKSPQPNGSNSTGGGDDGGSDVVNARLVTLENQHKRILSDNTAILAEIRGLREDMREHREIFSAELTRVYEAVVARNSSEAG